MSECEYPFPSPVLLIYLCISNFDCRMGRRFLGYMKTFIPRNINPEPFKILRTGTRNQEDPPNREALIPETFEDQIRRFLDCATYHAGRGVKDKLH